DQSLTFTSFFGDHGQPTLTISHCSFTGNLAHVAASSNGAEAGSAQGGAVDIEFRAAATVSDSTFVSNRVHGGDGSAGAGGGYGAGGGINNLAGDLTVTNSQ